MQYSVTSKCINQFLRIWKIQPSHRKWIALKYLHPSNPAHTCQFCSTAKRNRSLQKSGRCLFPSNPEDSQFRRLRDLNADIVGSALAYMQRRVRYWWDTSHRLAPCRLPPSPLSIGRMCHLRYEFYFILFYFFHFWIDRYYIDSLKGRLEITVGVSPLS